MALVMRVKSASKNEFLSGLGLNPDDPATNNLYTAMKVSLPLSIVGALQRLTRASQRRLKHSMQS